MRPRDSDKLNAVTVDKDFMSLMTLVIPTCEGSVLLRVQYEPSDPVEQKHFSLSSHKKKYDERSHLLLIAEEYARYLAHHREWLYYLPVKNPTH